MAIRRFMVASMAFAVLAGFGPAGAQETRPTPFSLGETLSYEVTWSIFSAGEVVVTLQKFGGAAGDPYLAKTTARTRGFVSLLFKVDNEFRSVFDPETLCSRQISKIIHEGRRNREARIVFDAGRQLAILDERDLANPSAPPQHAENEIPACVEDVVSAFYFARHQPLQIGQSFLVPVNDGSKTRQIRAEVQAHERIETPLGRRMAFRVEPTVFGELYKRKGRMLVWFSDDDRHLPLRVKAMVANKGVITVTLKSMTTSPGAAAPLPKPR